MLHLLCSLPGLVGGERGAPAASRLRLWETQQLPLLSGRPVGVEVLFSMSLCVHSPRSLALALPRDLEARAQNEFFRAFFRLPRKERLHAVVDCSLWTPFSRCHTVGRMFTSDSYICFASREDGCCNVVLPLREVDPGAHPCCLALPLEPKSLSLFYVPQTKYSRERNL